MQKITFIWSNRKKYPEKRRDGYQTNCYTNFYPKHDLQMELIVYSNEMMQDGALTLFALYDLYRTNATHEQ